MRRLSTSGVGAIWITCLIGIVSSGESEIAFRGPTDITPNESMTLEDSSFSPSGLEIAVGLSDGAIADPGRTYLVGVFDPGAAEYRELAGVEGPRSWNDGISWSPDGTKLMILHAGDHGWSSAIIDTQTGAVELVDRRPNLRTGPMWLPNQDHDTYPMSTAAFSSLRLRRITNRLDDSETGFVLDAPSYNATEAGTEAYRSLWYVDPSGAFMTLVMPKPDFSWIKVSPDRSYAVIGNYDDSIHVVRGDGSELTQIADSAHGVGEDLKSAYVQWNAQSNAFLYRTVVESSDGGEPSGKLWLVELGGEDIE